MTAILHKTRSGATPNWWRMLVIAAATLVLCSCRGLSGPGPDTADSTPPTPAPPLTLPREAWTGGPTELVGNPPHPHLPWAPPGAVRPWPRDEYINDGGDRELAVRVGHDWTVYGLDAEDTVAHYDTLDGRTEVKPSNCVPIYAPRFAAVRKVSGLVQYQLNEGAAGVDLATGLHRHDELLIAGTVLQPIQPEGQLGLKAPAAFRDRIPGLGLGTARALIGLQGDFLPHEDLQLIRRGVFDATEKPRLAQSIQAALAWSLNEAVQVVVDETVLSEAIRDVKAEGVHIYELPPGKPCLQVCKVASKKAARPGDIIDFTIRFDNIGNQPLGNVTILDSLTTRLEYVPETAQSSLPAEFFTVENEAESLILRWEITDPIPVGQGGVVRFQCRVR